MAVLDDLADAFANLGNALQTKIDERLPKAGGEVAGNLSVTGTLNMAVGHATGALGTDSVLSAGSGVNVVGNLSVNGAAGISGAATVGSVHSTGAGAIDGTLTSGAATVNGNLEVNGAFHADGDISGLG